MHLDFTDEQKMLRETLSRFLAEKYDFETRKKIIESETNERREFWASLAELGAFALVFPEDLGGLGGTPSDMLVLSHTFGEALCVEPWFATLALSGSVLRECGKDAVSPIIEDVIAGNTQLSLAYVESQSGYDPSYVETSVQQVEGGYVLNGKKIAVLGAPSADQILVSARMDGDVNSREGIHIFILDAATSGVNIQPYRTSVGLELADVILENVKLDEAAKLSDGESGLSLLESALEWGVVALCGEASGNCQRVLALTTQYSQERKQFGQPLSKFQALQHKMADMFIRTEEMVSMSYLASIEKQKMGPESKHALSAAKAQIALSCGFVGETAVQLHGGMGMSEEMVVGHYFMHGALLDNILGDRDYHLKRMIEFGAA